VASMSRVPVGLYGVHINFMNIHTTCKRSYKMRSVQRARRCAGASPVVLFALGTLLLLYSHHAPKTPSSATGALRSLLPSRTWSDDSNDWDGGSIDGGLQRSCREE
jgi:hypothetical protein